ncbi:MAG: ABC transporter ATP-binding protein [Selenomonadales bacterium]|nr:ABC transporter ATP-binding protein [Selenomonadales bacterium]
MPRAIDLVDVGHTYMTKSGETEALKGISLSIAEGEFIGIVGPSGSGKSTLLSLLAGLVKPTTGEITIFGKKVVGSDGTSAYMLQQDCLLEWRSVLDNALLGLEIMRKLTPASRARTNELLVEYGLSDFRHLYPRQLSGGMRQRVALIRTLAAGPSVCLLDEPFSALDYTSRLSLQADVSAILRQAGITCVLVTHDIPEAIALCDRVIVLTNRPGSVKADLPVVLSGAGHCPMQRRQAPEFREYFARIWGEMEQSVKARLA